VAGRRRDNRGVAPYPRAWRINQVVRQVLAEEIERLADADERLRLVTVTSVDTAPDLRHATVYLSSLPDPAEEALTERRARLQWVIGHEVRMKRTPQLTFAVDPGVVAGDRVEEVLRRLHETTPDETTGPADSATDDPPDGEGPPGGDR
jgi:ribosome-binding factor A